MENFNISLILGIPYIIKFFFSYIKIFHIRPYIEIPYMGYKKNRYKAYIEISYIFFNIFPYYKAYIKNVIFNIRPYIKKQNWG